MGSDKILIDTNFMPAPAADAVVFRNVYKMYEQDWVALYDVNFTIAQGELVCLLGASGAGKTTLLNHINLGEMPSQGEVEVLGNRTDILKNRRVAHLRRRVGVVFQDFKLLRGRTVFENIAFVPRLLGTKKRDVIEQVMPLLEQLKLTELRDRFPYQLSGGERQRVAIARALVNKPEIVLADEPTGNVNEETADAIMALFRSIHANGATVIIATHSRRLAENLPGRKIVLNKGQVAFDTAVAPPKDAPPEDIQPKDAAPSQVIPQELF